MTAIYCFSGSGHSLAVSSALAEMLSCKLKLIGPEHESTSEDVAVVVFPVYCQNIPSPVTQFLKRMEARHIVLIATYGKISHGNVLYEAQALLHGEVIAGAYIPIGHTFLKEDAAFDAAFLRLIVQRIHAPQKVCIPKVRKNPFANILPELRSRISVKITKGVRCNHCGLCERVCPVGAIRNGTIHSKCIRCLRCVTNCPQKALQFQNRWILQQYLKRCRKEAYLLYL